MSLDKILSLVASIIKSTILFLLIFFHSNISSEETTQYNPNDQGVLSIMYHRFNESKFPSTNVSEEQFFSHIKYIQENDFDILDIDQVIKSIDEGKVFSKKSIALTVDDAYESFYSVAWPYLKENNIPVTLFVSTDSVDQDPGVYMSWEQIRNFVSEGGIVGQHTASHLHMPLNDIDKVKDDIINSQNIFLKETAFY